MPTAYSYVRFSTKEQRKGDSLRRQTEARDKWLAAHPEVTLDSSLVMSDEGKSGFKRDDWDSYALKRFIDRIGSTVKPGSYLLVENLDRLTREEVTIGAERFLAIVNKGIVIVQLMPEPTEFRLGQVDIGKLVLAVFELSRANNESKLKSERISAAKETMRQSARSKGLPSTRVVPAWIEVVGIKEGTKGKKDFSQTKFRLLPDPARTVKQIFKWCIEGLGTPEITARLRAEPTKYPPFGRSGNWTHSYVVRILRSRETFGEYQPCFGDGSKAGDHVSSYFPVVVTEAIWWAAKKARESRHNRSGRPPADPRRGLFTGFIHDAIDQCPLQVTTRRQGRKLLVSAKANRGEGGRWCTFPLEVFTDAILDKLSELKGDDLFEDPDETHVLDIEKRIRDTEDALSNAEKHYRANVNSERWPKLINEFESELRRLKGELAKAQDRIKKPLSTTWAQATSLMEARKDPRRLRLMLTNTVEAIYCVFATRGEERRAVVQVHFKGNDERRHYIIVYRPEKAGFLDVPQHVECNSWLSKDPHLKHVHDLRDPEYAELIRSGIEDMPAIDQKPDGTVTIEWPKKKAKSSG